MSGKVAVYDHEHTTLRLLKV